MEDIRYLQKDDKVITNKSTQAGYKAISEEKVTGEVRKALITHGVVIIPIEQLHSRTDDHIVDNYGKAKISRLSTVDTKYRIQNIDDIEDYVIAVSSGTGVDTQDKGVGKAMTYSYKYLLLRTFAIPTGEDPDKTSSDIIDEELNAKKTNIKKDDSTNEPKKASPSQRKYIIDAYGDKLQELLNKKELAKIEDMTFAMASELIKKIEEKKEEK